jgi:hypothetical protein
MSDEEGALTLAGRDIARAKTDSFRDQVQAARAAVAARPEFEEDPRAITRDNPILAAIDQRLRSQENAKILFDENWSLALVDLRRVASLQQNVAAIEAAERVASVDASDLESIAEVTLPRPTTVDLPAQFDPAKNAWIVSAPNPNLRIVSAINQQMSSGTFGMGFGVAIVPSFLQVAIHHNRAVLRDGYHRAYGLLARGITHAPALVRDYGQGDLGVGVGLFTPDIYLSSRPPLLPDFLDSSVSADVDVPVVQRMIVIQGLELTPLA